jgi:hypothetical protein
MQIGDLVKHKQSLTGEPGLVVDMVQKKVWRAGSMGKKVDWSIVDPEPHAVVLFHHNDCTIKIPIIELEVINESS